MLTGSKNTLLSALLLNKRNLSHLLCQSKFEDAKKELLSNVRLEKLSEEEALSFLNYCGIRIQKYKKQRFLEPESSVIKWSMLYMEQRTLSKSYRK